MTKDARQFAEEWVSNNIHPTGYEPEGDAKAAKKAALEMLTAAGNAGISPGAIEEYTGKDIGAFMAGKIKSVNDAEVERLVAKDK